MQLTKNAQVFTADNEQVGEVERVVLDPKTKEVSHIVVRKGFLVPADKVVPIDLIASATGNRVVLRDTAQQLGKLEKLPDFEEREFIFLDESEFAKTAQGSHVAQPLYWYPPRYDVAYEGSELPQLYPTPPYVVETERNIPEGSIALKEGAVVFSSDGERLGTVDRILTGPEADQASHIIVTKGLLHHEKKLVPTVWIDEVFEDRIQLTIGASVFKALRDYEE